MCLFSLVMGCYGLSWKEVGNVLFKLGDVEATVKDPEISPWNHLGSIRGLWRDQTWQSKWGNVQSQIIPQWYWNWMNLTSTNWHEAFPNFFFNKRSQAAADLYGRALEALERAPCARNTWILANRILVDLGRSGWILDVVQEAKGFDFSWCRSLLFMSFTFYISRKLLFWFFLVPQETKRKCTVNIRGYWAL